MNFQKNNSLCLMVAFLLVTLLGGASAFVAPQPRSIVVQQQHQSLSSSSPSSTFTVYGATALKMSSDNNASKKSDLPMLLDPGTKGGALFLALIAFVVPILFYEFITNVFGFDGIEAGKWIGGGFTVIATLAWVGTYIFRVATKDMTYVRNARNESSFLFYCVAVVIVRTHVSLIIC